MEDILRFSVAVENSSSCILIGELAMVMKQNNINIGEKRLFKWLRDRHYLCHYGEKYNLPTQKSIEQGLFEVKRIVITKPSGETMVTRTTKVTGKGQIYFLNKIKI